MLKLKKSAFTAVMAQWLARQIADLEAASSSLAHSSRYLLFFFFLFLFFLGTAILSMNSEGKTLKIHQSVR